MECALVLIIDFVSDPVLLCNDLGQIRDLTSDVNMLPHVDSSGRASMSIKDAARIAQGNNFMGLICRSSLLVRFPMPDASLTFNWSPGGGFWLTTHALLCVMQNVVPALVETIKERGLVLVADTSDEVGQTDRTDALAAASAMAVNAEWAYRMPDGVNGVMRANGVLRFNDTIDM